MKSDSIKKKLSSITSGKKKKEPYEDSPVKINSSTTVSEDPITSAEEAERNAKFRFEPNHNYFTICVYAFFFVAAAALVVFGITRMAYITAALSHLINVLSPFIIGVFIAFLINPLMKKIDSIVLLKLFHIKSVRARKIVSILLSYILVMGVLVIIILYVAPQIVDSLSELYSGKDALYSTILKYLNYLEKYFPFLNVDVIGAKLAESLPQLLSYLTDIIKNLIPVLLNLSVSIAKFAFNLLLSIAVSVYMLYDKRKISLLVTRVVYALLPMKKADNLAQTAKECNNIFGNFIVGKSIDSLIIGVLCFIILTLFHFPYAVLVSVIVGITNMIPYFGPFIGAVPGIILYLCLSFVDALAFSIIILILQQFDGWILGPKILGDSTGLSPIWVILAIIIGGAYAGVLGMFLGVPVIAVLAFLINKMIVSKLKKKKLDIS